jgi:hypothetical protein
MDEFFNISGFNYRIAGHKIGDGKRLAERRRLSKTDNDELTFPHF